jgi:di/tricarboxylate transporter
VRRLRGYSIQRCDKAIAASLITAASITPAAYQTNLMVYGPGEYSFSDFVKMGIPLTLLVGVITIWLAPVFFPF